MLKTSMTTHISLLASLAGMKNFSEPLQWHSSHFASFTLYFYGHKRAANLLKQSFHWLLLHKYNLFHVWTVMSLSVLSTLLSFFFKLYTFKQFTTIYISFAILLQNGWSCSLVMSNSGFSIKDTFVIQTVDKFFFELQLPEQTCYRSAAGDLSETGQLWYLVSLGGELDNPKHFAFRCYPKCMQIHTHSLVTY